jgi:hypothetical protein
MFRGRQGPTVEADEITLVVLAIGILSPTLTTGTIAENCADPSCMVGLSQCFRVPIRPLRTPATRPSNKNAKISLTSIPLYR